MPPIPAPGADEDATPLYGIRKPKSSRLAKFIWQSIARIGDDVESALQTFGLPTVATGAIVVAASAAARDAHWGVPATAAARRALQDSGAVTIRTDTGIIERYYAGPTDGGANTMPGYPTAGWKPLSSPWVDFATVATNLTVGSGGAVTCRWRSTGGGEIDVEYYVLLGSTPTVGAVSLTLPVVIANPSAISRLFIGDVCYIDEGTNSFPGSVLVPAAGTSILLRTGPSGTASTSPISSTVPHNWAATDKIMIRLRLPVAVP